MKHGLHLLFLTLLVYLLTFCLAKTSGLNTVTLYKQVLARSPVLTHIVQAGTITALGDSASQILEGENLSLSTWPRSKQLRKHTRSTNRTISRLWFVQLEGGMRLAC